MSHDHGSIPPSVPQHLSLQMLGNNMADEFNNGGTMLLLCVVRPSTAVLDIHDHKT